MGAIAFSINDRVEADAMKIRLGGLNRYEIGNYEEKFKVLSIE